MRDHFRLLMDEYISIIRSGKDMKRELGELFYAISSLVTPVMDVIKQLEDNEGEVVLLTPEFITTLDDLKSGDVVDIMEMLQVDQDVRGRVINKLYQFYFINRRDCEKR